MDAWGNAVKSMQKSPYDPQRKLRLGVMLTPKAEPGSKGNRAGDGDSRVRDGDRDRGRARGPNLKIAPRFDPKDEHLLELDPVSVGRSISGPNLNNSR